MASQLLLKALKAGIGELFYGRPAHNPNFYLLLPVAMSIIAPQTHNFSILVVDDDPDICMALTDFLGEQGHQVSAVGTGTEAVDRVTNHQFDAVLLDVGLPDIDGLAVLNRLNDLKPHLPIIILTAYTSLGKRAGILDIPGAYASLSKPYKVQDLNATVGRALCFSAPACRNNKADEASSKSKSPIR